MCPRTIRFSLARSFFLCRFLRNLPARVIIVTLPVGGCRSLLLRQNGLGGRVQGKVKGEGRRAKGEGNDFEIFVAVHKFEGGGRAYLNTDRAFPASDSFS